MILQMLKAWDSGFSKLSLGFAVRNHFLLCNMNLSHLLYLLSSNLSTNHKCPFWAAVFYICRLSSCFFSTFSAAGWPGLSFLPPRLFPRPHSIIIVPGTFTSKFKAFIKSSTQHTTPAQIGLVLCRMERWSCQCCRLHLYFFFSSLRCFYIFCSSMMSLTHVQLVIHSNCQLLFFSSPELLITHLPSITCPYLE